MRFYKNWPYWFRGGILTIFLILLFMVITLAAVGVKNSCTDFPSLKFMSHPGISGNYNFVCLGIPYATLPLFFPILLFEHLMDSLRINYVYYYSIEQLPYLGWYCLALYFLIGSVPGFFYGKIKNRHKTIRISSEKTIELVWKVKGEMSATLTKGYLENEGISAHIASYSSGNKGSGPGAVFGVYVGQKDVEKAVKILEERNKKFKNNEN